MGGPIFAEVYQTVSKMSVTTGTVYYLQGTLGSGESHILAALVCLLIKEGKRVVYLPEAKPLATDLVGYTQYALQLAYADDEVLFERIQGFSSMTDILKFAKERSRRGEWWYLICDQMNTLYHFPNTDNSLGPDAQPEALQFIQRLSEDHYFICAKPQDTDRQGNYGPSLTVEVFPADCCRLPDLTATDFERGHVLAGIVARSVQVEQPAFPGLIQKVTAGPLPP